jgi:hypothetical protein
MNKDRQLRHIRLAGVIKKRQLDQALNAKEFAVCAGVSYTTARAWFRLKGFPAFNGVVFWGDFAAWRQLQTTATNDKQGNKTPMPLNDLNLNLPEKARSLLSEV